jgi:Cu(I)/Ag(I) efflux system membrane protein CusA/SilA
MIDAIIRGAVRNRILVLLAAVALTIVGINAYRSVPLDAIPDLSDVQVIVLTEYPGQSPQVVEDQVTYPLTTAMLSVPDTKVVRGYSFFGLSFVYIIFEDHVDMYWARSRVLEYLNYSAGRLPEGVSPTLGPDATGVGWVYQYALVDRSGRHDLSDLRAIQDWYLRYPLQTVPGVAEVASIGGFVRQYQVEVDPSALLRYQIPLHKVKTAIQESNNDVGGRLIELAETEYMVRSQGYIRGIEDIQSIPVAVDDAGVPVRIRDVAHVQLGPDLRRGLADLDGEGETAGGIVIMRFGENAMTTIEGVKAKLDSLRDGLPEGVEIVPVYDRSDLISRAVASLNRALLEELLVVSAVVMLFLLHARSALVAIITLPLGILLAFIVMQAQGLNANIMSLGGIAIAIGAMVDGAIVMIENGHAHLSRAVREKGAELTGEEHWRTILAASREVGPALFFSLLVITVSFLPIFTMQAQEGRLFSPLAFTKTYAMAAAAILSITLVPVLMGYFLRGRIRPAEANPLNAWLTKAHRPLLVLAMRHRGITLALALLLLATTAWPLSRIGSEFMPPLDEGDILYMPTTFPGISISRAREVLQQTDRILATFPEVLSVFGKVGRAETATDPAPLSMLETTVRLKPREQWPNPEKSTRELMDEMDAALQFPGLANSWTMPIKTRIDMLSTGIKTPVGIKVSGPDLEVLQSLSEEIEGVMKGIPGTLSAFGDRAVGGYYLDFAIDREQAARYGLTVGAVQDVIKTAIGGMNVTETVEGLERFPVNVRYPRALREDLETLRRVLIPTPTGQHIPLAMVANISYERGPPVIKSEAARPNAWVYVDIADDDIGGYVRHAKEVLSRAIDLPPGYALSWSGQYEYMERAARRLAVVAPTTLAIILLLLYLHFRNLTQPLVVLLAVPFGLIGGLWLVYLNGYNLSVAVAVGFIALAGMAAEIGVLVLSFIDVEIKNRKQAEPGEVDAGNIGSYVVTATNQRVRPVVMTVVSTMAGLVPIMLNAGTGSDVTQRIAAPMLGGMLTVLILNLLVLPVIYSLVLQWREPTPGV